jgi:tungstate transport system substrate-binding protein
LKRLIIFISLFYFSSSASAEAILRLSTTTSTENSGLLTHLNPPFEQQYKVRLDVIAVGSGKALKLAENGDVDVVFVHAPSAELEFVNAGFGINRQAVMHNDFVLLGPESDPAALKSAINAADALKKISTAQAAFVSRGDDSGTHKKEKSLWAEADIAPSGKWYFATGQGMGEVLRIADEKQAYTLADRGTFLSYQDKLDLVVVFAGDPQLFNPYHIIAVNPKRHTHSNYTLAKHYIDYVTGAEGQAIIRNFKLAHQQLFYPNAK